MEEEWVASEASDAAVDVVELLLDAERVKAELSGRSIRFCNVVTVIEM